MKIREPFLAIRVYKKNAAAETQKKRIWIEWFSIFVLSKKLNTVKKLTLLLLFFGMVFIHQAAAQERQIIQGYCKDENGKPIENVSVYVQDSLLVSVTDEQGRFTYSLAKSGL